MVLRADGDKKNTKKCVSDGENTRRTLNILPAESIPHISKYVKIEGSSKQLGENETKNQLTGGIRRGEQNRTKNRWLRRAKAIFTHLNYRLG